jgi:hypothetical protein
VPTGYCTCPSSSISINIVVIIKLALVTDKTMPYDEKLADRVRKYLKQIPRIQIEEKKMFGGLAFMVNGKMCINVSGENLMCRFDPALTEKLTPIRGVRPTIMKGRRLKGYCYVEPAGIETTENFEFWIKLCLDFNQKGKVDQ